MKHIGIVLLGLCAAACTDGRSDFGRINIRGAPELRFYGAFTGEIATSVPRTARMTYMGRTIRYEQGALYVDDQRLILPAETRVVAFDGSSIYVDGRDVESL